MEKDDFSDGPQIASFYAGRNILITGGSGFMGKVLIERLLATCPGIGRLYLLMRFKNNISPDERLLQLKQCQVFDVIRKKCPWQLDKLFVLPGDVTKPQLGLLPQSFSSLAEVSIVFHSAASVKFEEPLQTAVNFNLRPVMELLEMCDKLPFLEAFVYVSTAYCNSDRYKIDERVYEPSVKLQDLLNFVDSAPEDYLNVMMTRNYIKPKPNTYTFTKAMAEYVVAQHDSKKYSVSVFRPTIVTASLKHPFPGWIENFYGPTGLIVGMGKGVLHVLRTALSKRSDQLPVDIAIDTLIAVAWETAIERSSTVRVYNCSTIENPTTNKEFKAAVLKYLNEYPLGKPFYYPYIIALENRYLHKVLEMCLQTLPLYVAEYLTNWLGQKKTLSLKTLSRRISTMSETISFFITREFDFETNNFRRLRERLSKADAAVYNLDPKTIVWKEYNRNFVHGVRKYLIKLNDNDITSDQKYINRLRILHYGACIAVFSFIIKLLNKFGCAFMKKIWHRIQNIQPLFEKYVVA